MTDMQHKLHIDAGSGEGGALAALARLDPDVASALDRYGPPPDRSLPASFETLARAIVGQQYLEVAGLESLAGNLPGLGIAQIKTISIKRQVACFGRSGAPVNG